MPIRLTRSVLLAFSLLAPVSAAAQEWSASSSPRRTTAVVIVGQEASLPIPTLMEGAAAAVANIDVADQLFLRLAGLGPTLNTSGDKGFVPLLARSWSRRDSLTLVFELDPRARWHDGTPVTARDVVFTFGRARDPKISPRFARPLRYLESVTAEGDRRVVFRFNRAYSEQLYDATYHVQPLPAHLVGSMDSETMRRSDFAARPVGNGPFRWGRQVRGQFTELVANDDFFLGRPELDRVIFRVAASADARLNLLLSGEGDALESAVPPLANIERIESRPNLRLVAVPSATVGYLLFNLHDRADRTRPHPILGDVRVRQAVARALDRRSMVRAAFGPYSEVPVGPVSQLLWIGKRPARAAPQDTAEARRLLAAAGWRDTDGDGVLDRDGRPLALALNLPNTSAPRRQIALQAQEQLRQLGIRIDLVQLDGPVWLERRTAGQFDIDFSSASQDPSPSGLMQSWSCLGIGGSNVGGYCNPAVDSLIERAIFTQSDPAPLWHAAVDRIVADAPAVFIYAPSYVVALSRRFDDATIRPESSWLRLRDWSLR